MPFLCQLKHLEAAMPCAYCGIPLPLDADPRRKTCSASCRTMLSRRRRRAAAEREISNLRKIVATLGVADAASAEGATPTKR